jgi:FKBP-type peptidyl-prolyl cis-trans isomerase SlyD
VINQILNEFNEMFLQIVPLRRWSCADANFLSYMIIEKNKAVYVHYTLTEGTAEGQMVETTENREPLGFLYGVGSMIPDFERNLSGLKAGDQFAFGIAAKDAYGEYDEGALVEVPLSIFETDGKVPDGLLEIGNMLPLRDQEGNYLEGMVAGVSADRVKIDFNHPMAGVDLFFKGHVDKIREAEQTEIEHGHLHDHGHHH